MAAITALQTTDATNRQTPCSRLSSDAALLKLVEDFQPGIDQRLATRAERERLASLAEHYEAWLRPAPRSKIEELVTTIALGYPAMRVTPAEADARLALYVAALSDIPADILEKACMAALQNCRFFPSVQEIRERCGEMGVRAYRLSRITYLIAKHDREWREPEPEAPLSAEDQAKVQDWLRRNGIGEAA